MMKEQPMQVAELLNYRRVWYQSLNSIAAHCSLLRSRGLFWWKWLIGQAMAALNFILNCRVMEQSGADENYIGGILACLGAQNTIQICRKMDLDLTIPNSLIGLPCLAGVAEC